MNKKKKILIDILCTSKNSSGMPHFRPSLEEASILLSKITGEYESELYIQQLRYDKLEEDNSNEIDFEKRIQKIRARIEKQVQSIYRLIPSLVIEDLYEVDINDPEVAILKEYLNQFNRFRNNDGAASVRLMDFSQEYHLQIEPQLLELSKAVIARNVAKHVDQEIAIHGRFNALIEFTSVPEACKYFCDTLKDGATVKELKDQIKKFARIKENGKDVEWNTTNKRINSWISYQESIYNGVKLIKE